MTEVSSGSPVTELVSLMARCNRSEPQKEVIIVSECRLLFTSYLHYITLVVSTTLDILINISRVSINLDKVASVPNLLSDLFQGLQCRDILQMLRTAPAPIRILHSKQLKLSMVITLVLTITFKI